MADFGIFVCSDFFANIAMAISALGTIAAVIVSLYLSRRGEKIKYKIQRQLSVPLNYVGDFSLLFDIELVNLSTNNQIIISSFPYLKTGNKHIILKNYVPIYDVNEDSYKFPRKLNYGESLIVSIDKEIRAELLKCSRNNFYLVIQDVLGNKYKYRIRRKELEIILKNE